MGPRFRGDDRILADKSDSFASVRSVKIYGRTGSHRRSGPHRLDARHRPRAARRARAGDRAEGCSAIPPEDGALQRPHHGDLPAHGHRGGGSRRRAPRALPHGHLRRVVAGRAGAGAPRASVRGRGKGADRQIRGRKPAARALSAHLAIYARAAAEIDRGDVAERHRALRMRARVIRAGWQFGHCAGQEQRRRFVHAARRLYGRLRRRRQPGAPATRHQPQR